MPHTLTIHELTAQLSAKQLTAREATQACLDRIAAVDDRLNAFNPTMAQELIAAFELEDAEADKLVAALKERLGRDVQVSTSVDESLIGGVLVRAGDTVIDGSVRGRLSRLAEQLNS